MKELHDSGTWLRRRLHLVAAVALGVPMSLALHASTGDAALQYDTGEFTRFEIDGDAVPGVHSNGDPLNAAVDGDWGLTPADYGYGPQPIGSDPAQPAPAGLGSSGILPLEFDQSRADDYPLRNPVPNPQFGVMPGATEFCVESDDIWTGGTKAASSLVNIDDPLFGPGGTLNLTCGQALDKGDLFRAYVAYEVVAVPNVHGDPTSGSQNHTVLYGAWERGEEPGELNFYIPVSDSIAGNSAGDRLIAFDYNSSRPAAYRILAWNGSEWAVITSGDTGTNTTSFEVAVGYVEGRPFGASGRPSFGEFALDLTATGVLPSEQAACVDLTTSGYIFTETGNSASAQLKDYVQAPSLPIGNCGTIDVEKAGPDAASAAPEFGYRVEQVDHAAIFPTASVPAGQTVNRIDDMIAIGETDHWTGVYAQPDYLVYEPQPLVTDPASSGWEQVMVTCTYVDMFTAGYPIVTDQMLFDGTTHVPGTLLQVQSPAFLTLAGHAGFVPSCTITNDAAGVIVEKAGVGDAGTVFGIDVGGQPVALHLGESAFVAADAGTELTIGEPPIVGASPNWDLTAIECFDEGATAPFITGDLALRSVGITTGGFDNTIRCVFTNVQRGSITIAKTVTPPLGQRFTFETTTLPGGDFVLGNGQSTTFSNLIPGVYRADEAAVPGWITQSISCISAGSSQTQTDTAAGLATITLAAGGAVTCTYANVALPGELTVDKAISGTIGATSPWSFGLELRRVDPPALVASGILSGTGTLSSGPAMFGGLTPGVAYQISEQLPAGWTSNGVSCTVTPAGVVEARVAPTPVVTTDGSFVVLPGSSVSCTFDNSANPGSLTLVKTTSGADDRFSFTVTPSVGDVITPVITTVGGTGTTQVTGLVPGVTYSVTEVDPGPRWVPDLLSCSVLHADQTAAVYAAAGFVVLPGDAVTCSMANTEQGVIVVDKVTQPAGDPAVFDFTIAAIESEPDTFTLAGTGAPHSSGLVPPGTYVVTELAEPGWELQGVTCTGGENQVVGATATVEVDPGGVVTCTFTNAKHGPLTITKTVTAGPTRVAQDTYTITYEVKVTSQSHVNEVYNLVDRVRFGEGVTVVSASAVGPTGVTLVPTWNGTTQTTLASDVALAPQASHTYTVTASGKVQLTSAESSRDCVLATTETGTGMLNESTVVWHEGEAKAEVCRPIPPPEPADLAIVKSASVTTTGPDGGFDWILSVTNKGPATAANVIVGDLVPTQVTVTGVRSNEFTCSVTGNQVTCRKPSMAVGESGTVTISVIVPGNAVSGSVVDVGTVVSDTPDTDLSNNSDDAKVDIVVQLPPTTPPPSILPDTGTHSAVPVTTGGAMLLTIGGLALLVTRIRRRGDLGAA